MTATTPLMIGPMILSRRTPPVIDGGGGDDGDGVATTGVSVGMRPFPSVQVVTKVEPPRVNVCVLTSASCPCGAMSSWYLVCRKVDSAGSWYQAGEVTQFTS